MTFRHHDDPVIEGSLATLCGLKATRVFIALRETALDFYKTPSMRQSFNDVTVPLSRTPMAPVVLGRCSPGRCEILLWESEDQRAQSAVRQLALTNFPLVLRLGTRREFHVWFSQLARRLRTDFERVPPAYGSSSGSGSSSSRSINSAGGAGGSMQPSAKVDALSSMVLWYYCEGKRSRADAAKRTNHTVARVRCKR
jgi:hypothetical protein